MVISHVHDIHEHNSKGGGGKFTFVLLYYTFSEVHRNFGWNAQNSLHATLEHIGSKLPLMMQRLSTPDKILELANNLRLTWRNIFLEIQSMENPQVHPKGPKLTLISLLPPPPPPSVSMCDCYFSVLFWENENFRCDPNLTSWRFRLQKSENENANNGHLISGSAVIRALGNN